MRDRKIYEIPVEMNSLKQTVENSIQTVDYLKSQLLDISTSENLNDHQRENTVQSLNESKESNFNLGN